MNRKSQVRHCLLCRNRKWDRNQGTICGLTNQYATFKNTCPDYKNDRAQRKKILEKKLFDYGITGNQRSIVVDSLNDESTSARETRFYQKPTKGLLKALPKEHLIGKSFRKYLLWYILPLFLVAYFFGNSWQEWTTRKLLIDTFIFLALIAYPIGDYFFGNKPLKVSTRGVFYKGELIQWQVILGTIIQSKQSRGMATQYLILLMPYETDIEINLNGLAGSNRNTEQVIALYKLKNQLLRKAAARKRQAMKAARS